MQLQELEMENAQLKKDLGSLRKTVAEADPHKAQQHLMGKLGKRVCHPISFMQ